LQSSRPLPAIALNKIKESLSIEWTYNSNSIEGNSLSLRETQMVIQEGITIKGKSLRNILKRITMIKPLIIYFQ
jgi:Fic family protein